LVHVFSWVFAVQFSCCGVHLLTASAAGSLYHQRNDVCISSNGCCSSLAQRCCGTSTCPIWLCCSTQLVRASLFGDWPAFFLWRRPRCNIFVGNAFEQMHWQQSMGFSECWWSFRDPSVHRDYVATCGGKLWCCGIDLHGVLEPKHGLAAASGGCV
jgi:hypothetical protein